MRTLAGRARKIASLVAINRARRNHRPGRQTPKKGTVMHHCVILVLVALSYRRVNASGRDIFYR
jgi:hypothetical protein